MRLGRAVSKAKVHLKHLRDVAPSVVTVAVGTELLPTLAVDAVTYEQIREAILRDRPTADGKRATVHVYRKHRSALKFVAGEQKTLASAAIDARIHSLSC